MKIAAASAITFATIVGACDAFAQCSPEDDPVTNEFSWEMVRGASALYPGNAALLLNMLPDAVTAEVDGDEADVVPAGFPVMHSVFIDPLPDANEHVSLRSSGQGTPLSMSFTAGEHDVTPPELLSPIHYDLHDHPRIDCDTRLDADFTYHLRIDLGARESPEIVLVDAYTDASRSERLFGTFRIYDDEPMSIKVNASTLGDLAPEDLCLGIRITDAAGNALEQVLLCSPCHLAVTSSNQRPEWTDATLYPSGTCTPPMPASERLPGLAPTPDASGCSTTGRPTPRGWEPLLALLLLARTLVRPRSVRHAGPSMGISQR